MHEPQAARHERIQDDQLRMLMRYRALLARQRQEPLLTVVWEMAVSAAVLHRQPWQFRSPE